MPIRNSNIIKGGVSLPQLIEEGVQESIKTYVHYTGRQPSARWIEQERQRWIKYAERCDNQRRAFTAQVIEPMLIKTDNTAEPALTATTQKENQDDAE